MRSTNADLLLETLTSFLAAHPAEHAAVGYSGGRDSGVLLWSLVQVLGSHRVTAIHVDHGWRPADERREERALVEKFCQTLGTGLVVMDPPSAAERTEAAARAHRYRCFRQFLDARPEATVFLAHHADDQAETILMRLLKGRSWQGLAGMSPVLGPFRRPFLTVPGEILARACAELSLPFHHDSSNDDVSYARNFLRRLFPRLKTRFPRAVSALAEFGQVWGQAALLQEPHPAWERVGRGYQIRTDLWAAWSGLERQAQLLATLSESAPGQRVARRFLEIAATKAAGERVRGAGWQWSWEQEAVSWSPVAPGAGKEYFIDAQPGRWYDLEWYRFQWNDDKVGLWIPGVAPQRPWVWRSPVRGMRYASAQDSDWGRVLKKKRFGNCPPAAAALVVQDGLVRAVVDARENRVVWSESGAEKLHNPGIFVTLVTVTPISTE